MTSPVLDWLWLTTWQAAVLIALVAVVCIVGRRALAPRWRYALWLLVAVRLVMPALPQSPLSLFNLFGWEAEAEQAGAVLSPVVVTQMIDVEAAALPALTVAPVRQTPWTWQHWLIAAWLSGAALCAAAMLLANGRLLRALRRHGADADEPLRQILEDAKRTAGVRRNVRLVMVATTRAPGGGAVAVPALVGWLRPAIVLPQHLRERLDDEQLRFVMLHELAHLRRHDVLVQWLLLPLHALHWFNPLVWWAGACLRNERELACDEQVLRWTQPQRRAEYGRSLLAVMELTRNVRVLPGEAFSGGGGAVPMASSNLFRRIDMISRSDRQGLTRRGRWIIGVTAMAAVVAVAMTGAADGQQGRYPQAQRPQQPTQTAPIESQRPPVIIYEQPGGRPMVIDPATGEATYVETTPRRGSAPRYTERGAMPGYSDNGGGHGTYEGGEMSEYGGYGSQTPRPAPPPPSAATSERALSAAQQRRRTAEGMPQPESARRLASARIDVNFDQNALRDVIDFIADSADVNIVVHWQHLERAGFDPQAPVTIHTREPISAATTLQLVLEQLSTPAARLTMEARPEVVVISADGGPADPYSPFGATRGVPGMEGMAGMMDPAGMAEVPVPPAPAPAPILRAQPATSAPRPAAAAPAAPGSDIRQLHVIPGDVRIVDGTVLVPLEPQAVTELGVEDRMPAGHALRLVEPEQDQAMQLRRASMSQLKNLALMLHLYANDHDGRLPAAISEKEIGRYAQDHGGYKPSMTNPRLNKFPGYIYHRPAPRIADVPEGTHNTPVLYEAFDTWPGEIAIAFLDGHVEVVTDKDRAKELLDKMNADVRFE